MENPEIVSIDRLCMLSFSASLPACPSLFLTHSLSSSSSASTSCSVEDIEQQKKQDSDSGVGSDNGDKRLEVLTKFPL